MGNGIVEIRETTVHKSYGLEHADSAAKEVKAYSEISWATPVLLDHGDLWIVVERLTPILHLPPDQSIRYKEPLRDLLQSVHDSGYWHGDCTLINVVVDPKRGPLLIDWENLTPASGDVSYDLHGAASAGVGEIWPIIGGDGVSWAGPWDTCPGVYWRNL